MSSSHCLGKSRHLRQERVAVRRATVPVLANGDRGRGDLVIVIDKDCCLLETHSLIDAVNAQNYDRGKQSMSPLFNRTLLSLVLDLLQSGVDPRPSDKHGRTALHVACTKLDASIGIFANETKDYQSITFVSLAKALIDHGADVNAEDSLGNTPLHLACVGSRLPVVGVLLRAGASLAATKTRATPLTLALSRLQSLMNERRTISSPEMKAEILEVNQILSVNESFLLTFSLIYCS